MQQILTYAFLVIYTVTILGIVLVIITDNRNPLKTLPWIIVLVFAPVVGLVFYFFFGQNLSKQRIISRRTRKRITMQLEEALDDGRPDIPDEHLPLARPPAPAGPPVPLYGSRITPYTDGKSKMEALLAEIARAKHHIHIQYYIFCDDTTGCRLRDALIAFLTGRSTARALADLLLSQRLNYPQPLYYALMNLTASHDVARTRSALALDFDPRSRTRAQLAALDVTDAMAARGAQLQVFFRRLPAALAEPVVTAQLIKSCSQRAFPLLFAAHRRLRSDHGRRAEQQCVAASLCHEQNFSFPAKNPPGCAIL